MKDELEAARGNIEQLTKDISHRDMEIGYMRTDQEESEETIARCVVYFMFQEPGSGLASSLFRNCSDISF